MANALYYGFSFAGYAATISHTILCHRDEIVREFRALISRQGHMQSQNDIHSHLMSAYKEVPEWWYLSILVISIALGATGVGAFPTMTTPVVVLYGLLLALIFCVPIGIIYATTTTQVSLSVLAEFIGGSWFEGNALAMNFFKLYGYVTTAHTLSFVQALKLAHYTHIPPRVTFTCQVVATLVSAFVTTAVMNFQFTLPNVCNPGNKDRFNCYNIQPLFTASVLWGTLGPRKMYGFGAIYSRLLWSFLIGFALPIIFFFVNKRHKLFRNIHVPVLLQGGLIFAPGGLNNVWPAVPVGWFFNVYIKRRYLAWWSKYNYIMATSFSASIAICTIVTFFTLLYWNIWIMWWGNTVPFTDNCDSNKCPLLEVTAGEHFGPGVGEF